MECNINVMGLNYVWVMYHKPQFLKPLLQEQKKKPLRKLHMLKLYLNIKLFIPNYIFAYPELDET